MAEKIEQDNLLSRWSKRKLAAKSQQSGPVQPGQTAPEDAASDPAGDPQQPDPVLEENRLAAEAVDLETLTYESDFSVFMKDGVPDLLRRQALKALWRSSPILANVDGLVDYDDDFASPDLVMKTFDSAWKIGKGYFDDSQADPEVTALETAEAPEHEGQAQSLEPLTERAETADEPDEATSQTQLADLDVEEEDLGDLDAPDESEPVRPKISLRKRLMLDG